MASSNHFTRNRQHVFQQQQQQQQDLNERIFSLNDSDINDDNALPHPPDSTEELLELQRDIESLPGTSNLLPNLDHILDDLFQHQHHEPPPTTTTTTTTPPKRTRRTRSTLNDLHNPPTTHTDTTTAAETTDLAAVQSNTNQQQPQPPQPTDNSKKNNFIDLTEEADEVNVPDSDELVVEAVIKPSDEAPQFIGVVRKNGRRTTTRRRNASPFNGDATIVLDDDNNTPSTSTNNNNNDQLPQSSSSSSSNVLSNTFKSPKRSRLATDLTSSSSSSHLGGGGGGVDVATTSLQALMASNLIFPFGSAFGEATSQRISTATTIPQPQPQPQLPQAQHPFLRIVSQVVHPHDSLRATMQSISPIIRPSRSNSTRQTAQQQLPPPPQLMPTLQSEHARMAAASAASAAQKTELQCPICLESLDELKQQNKLMMATLCGHVLCNSCVDQSFKVPVPLGMPQAKGGQKTIQCPTCRSKLTRAKIHKLFI